MQLVSSLVLRCQSHASLALLGQGLGRCSKAPSMACGRAGAGVVGGPAGGCPELAGGGRGCPWEGSSAGSVVRAGAVDADGASSAPSHSARAPAAQRLARADCRARRPGEGVSPDCLPGSHGAGCRLGGAGRARGHSSAPQKCSGQQGTQPCPDRGDRDPWAVVVVASHDTLWHAE